MIAFGANDQTIYLNGAVVPSVKARGRKKVDTIRAGRSRSEPSFGSAGCGPNQTGPRS